MTAASTDRDCQFTLSADDTAPSNDGRCDPRQLDFGRSVRRTSCHLASFDVQPLYIRPMKPTTSIARYGHTQPACEASSSGDEHPGNTARESCKRRLHTRRAIAVNADSSARPPIRHRLTSVKVVWPDASSRYVGAIANFLGELYLRLNGQLSGRKCGCRARFVNPSE